MPTRKRGLVALGAILGLVWAADASAFRRAGWLSWRDESLASAGLIFIVVCLVGVVAATLIWTSRTRLIGFALLLVSFAGQAVFWWGFVLPWGAAGDGRLPHCPRHRLDPPVREPAAEPQDDRVIAASPSKESQ